MGKSIRYSEEFKKKTVQIYLKGNISATELARNLGVHPDTVYNWIRESNNGSVNIPINWPNETIENSVLGKCRSPKGLVLCNLYQRLYELEDEIALLKQDVVDFTKNNPH